jgi:putative hydrolase
MSDPAANDPGDPFRGLPLFGDLARLVQSQGPVSWDGARQLALSIASGGTSEPNVDPLERIKFEQLARVAELHVASTTGLATSITGRAVNVVPVTRSQWVLDSLDAYRPLFELLASSLSKGPEPEAGVGGERVVTGAGQDPGAWLSGLISMLSPMVLGMTAGSLVGHLAARNFGQYDLPIPRPPADDLSVLVGNLDEFGEAWSLDADDLRLWVCLHEIAHHAVLAVPHVRERLTTLLNDYASGFRADPDGLEARLTEIDPTDASGMQGIQEALGDPEVLLGAIQSPAQLELLPRLQALVMVVGGYVDHVMDRIGGSLMGSYGRVTEAMRRRRVESGDGDRFIERLFGLDLSQAHFDKGAAFVDGVVERAGDDGLSRLWESERTLPTPAEVEAPGLWLARLELDT